MIDAAWAALEAVLPPGWRISGIKRFDESHDGRRRWWADVSKDDAIPSSVRRHGPIADTPAAALYALRDAVAEITRWN